MSSIDVEIPDGASAIAVLLHPHPDMGGDRYNHVVGSLYRGLPAAGLGAARFDFSSSDIETAASETLKAIDEVAAAAPNAAIVLVAYSFGAMVATQVDDERVRGWFLVALPIDHVGASTLPTDPRPKAIAAPEFDNFTPAERVIEVASSWTATEVSVLSAADHFLAAATDELLVQVVTWIRSTVAP